MGLSIVEQGVLVKKVNIAVKELNDMDEVENISIDKEDNNNNRLMCSGEFDFFGIHYYFFYVHSDPLVIFQSSFVFTFEKFITIDELTIYRALNYFNDKNLGLKATLYEIDHDKKEVSVEFSSGLLLESERVEKNQTVDIQPGILLLSKCSVKFSKILIENGAKHDFLVDSDDEE